MWDIGTARGKNHQPGTTEVSRQATNLEAQWHPYIFPWSLYLDATSSRLRAIISSPYGPDSSRVSNLSLSQKTATSGWHLRTACGLVVVRCSMFVGGAHQMSDSTVSDSLVNGATVDLSPGLFSYLYEGAVEGVFDVLYNGSIYGGSWDGDPDDLRNPKCDAVGGASQAAI
jgi:hypothetical protein